MKRSLRIVIAMALAVVLAGGLKAHAATFDLPLGTSVNDFTISSPLPPTLTIAPNVNYQTNGCPNNTRCGMPLLDVTVTANFYDQLNNLLASNTENFNYVCFVQGCSGTAPPFSTAFPIPANTTNFSLTNIVTVNGGWTYVSGSEVVSAGTVTPIPGALPLFGTGLAFVTLLGRRNNRKLRPPTVVNSG